MASNTVAVTNTGTTGLADIVITVSGAGFSLGLMSTCTNALGVGQTCEIIVLLTGRTAGVATGAVIVSQGGVTKSASLSATVQLSEPPQLMPRTAALVAEVGTSGPPVTFEVTNPGDVPTGIPIVTLSGVNAADFSITSDSYSSGLAGGATCQATVVFSPKTISAANEIAILTVTSLGGSSAVATLTGTVY